MSRIVKGNFLSSRYSHPLHYLEQSLSKRIEIHKYSHSLLGTRYSGLVCVPTLSHLFLLFVFCSSILRHNTTLREMVIFPTASPQKTRFFSIISNISLSTLPPAKDGCHLCRIYYVRNRRASVANEGTQRQCEVILTAMYHHPVAAAWLFYNLDMVIRAGICRPGTRCMQSVAKHAVQRRYHYIDNAATQAHGMCMCAFCDADPWSNGNFSTTFCCNFLRLDMTD